MEQFLSTLQPMLTAAGLSWASGLRLYATLALVGVLHAVGLIQLPSALSLLANPWVIGISGVLALVEFFMDKIPGLDSIWDSIHTFVRIPAGMVLAAGSAVGFADHWVLLAGLVGGSLAATTHIAKAGSRLMINTSPEPFSNWGASFTEETLWAGVMGLMFAYPLAFAVFFALALISSVCLAIWVIKTMRGLLHRLLKPNRLHRVLLSQSN